MRRKNKPLKKRTKLIRSLGAISLVTLPSVFVLTSVACGETEKKNDFIQNPDNYVNTPIALNQNVAAFQIDTDKMREDITDSSDYGSLSSNSSKLAFLANIGSNFGQKILSELWSDDLSNNTQTLLFHTVAPKAKSYDVNLKTLFYNWGFIPEDQIDSVRNWIDISTNITDTTRSERVNIAKTFREKFLTILKDGNADNSIDESETYIAKLLDLATINDEGEVSQSAVFSMANFVMGYVATGNLDYINPQKVDPLDYFLTQHYSPIGVSADSHQWNSLFEENEGLVTNVFSGNLNPSIFGNALQITFSDQLGSFWLKTIDKKDVDESQKDFELERDSQYAATVINVIKETLFSYDSTNKSKTNNIGLYLMSPQSVLDNSFPSTSIGIPSFMLPNTQVMKAILDVVKDVTKIVDPDATIADEDWPSTTDGWTKGGLDQNLKAFIANLKTFLEDQNIDIQQFTNTWKSVVKTKTKELLTSELVAENSNFKENTVDAVMKHFYDIDQANDGISLENEKGFLGIGYFLLKAGIENKSFYS